jgi:hypothetical protein
MSKNRTRWGAGIALWMLCATAGPMTAQDDGGRGGQPTAEPSIPTVQSQDAPAASPAEEPAEEAPTAQPVAPRRVLPEPPTGWVKWLVIVGLFGMLAVLYFLMRTFRSIRQGEFEDYPEA